MNTPSPSRRLIEQFWSLRYKDHNEARTIAVAAEACAMGASKRIDETWARFLMLVCDTAREPLVSQLDDYQALRAEFALLGDEAGVTMSQVQYATVLWYVGRSDEGWEILRRDVEPQLHRLERNHRYTAYIGLLCAASGIGDEVA
ncbi:hypothetical protein, partial [Chitinimonas sp.]|uniref:hypothetical protein n=1 Tax=Chitinimonas sp. TaxID=1934313 RepID=UPI0035B09128